MIISTSVRYVYFNYEKKKKGNFMYKFSSNIRHCRSANNCRLYRWHLRRVIIVHKLNSEKKYGDEYL